MLEQLIVTHIWPVSRIMTAITILILKLLQMHNWRILDVSTYHEGVIFWGNGYETCHKDTGQMRTAWKWLPPYKDSLNVIETGTEHVSTHTMQFITWRVRGIACETSGHMTSKVNLKGNDDCRRFTAQLDMQTTTTSSRICARATSRATLRAGTLVWCIATRPPGVIFSFACSFTFVVSIESFESSLTAHWIRKKELTMNWDDYKRMMEGLLQ
jgi:hypothetical protein